MDVKVPGMVYASVVRSPRLGGTLKSFDVSKAKRVPGFIEAKVFPDKRGVVVYAKNTWSAFQTKKALLTKWDFSNAESRSTSDMVSDCQKLAENPEFEPRPFNSDDLKKSVKDLDHLEADFFFPWHILPWSLLTASSNLQRMEYVFMTAAKTLAESSGHPVISLD